MRPMSEAPSKPKRRRRWFRYSLRSLFVLITIFCVALGYWTHRANRQKAVVKWVKENGGEVVYDFEIDEKGDLIDDPKPPGPKWLREYLGKDYLGTVTDIVLRNNEVNDVTPLAQLEQLRALTLSNTKVSDLKPLAELTSLEFLSLHNNTQVSDLTPLTGLTSLTYLDLHITQVSDPTPLMHLKSLTELYLYDTQVTKEQINVLQESLPNCFIDWYPHDKPIAGK